MTAILLESCVTLPHFVGDVTTYDTNGNVLNEWNSVEIGVGSSNDQTNIFKEFGLNFYDRESQKYIIVSTSTPYIIKYDVVHKSIFEPNANELRSKESERAALKDLQEKFDSNNLKIKDPSTPKWEKKDLRKENNKLFVQINALKNELR